MCVSLMIKIVFASVRESERFIALSGEGKRSKGSALQREKRNATRSDEARKAALIFL